MLYEFIKEKKHKFAHKEEATLKKARVCMQVPMSKLVLIINGWKDHVVLRDVLSKAVFSKHKQAHFVICGLVWASSSQSTICMLNLQLSDFIITDYMTTFKYFNTVLYCISIICIMLTDLAIKERR